MEHKGPTDTLLEFAVRLSWGLAGPLALFFLAAYMFRDGLPPLSMVTGLYMGVVVLMAAIRLFDIEFLSGTTLGGRPVGFDHWKTYVVVLVLVASVLWGGVQWLTWTHDGS
jgi:hypothetical protein